MRHSTLALCFVLVTLAAGQSYADRNPDYEQVVIPVSLVGDFVSRSGVIWIATLAVRNDAGVEAVITEGPPECPFGCDHSYFPGEERTLAPRAHFGTMVHVRRDVSHRVSFSSRLVEKARPDRFIEMPVVREHDFRTEPFSLLRVPVTEQSRIDLRVYDPRSIDYTFVRITVHDAASDALLQEFDVRLEGEVFGDDEGTYRFPWAASYAYMPDIAGQFPSIKNSRSVRIVVTPLGGKEVWAFASFTDLESGQISLTTPQ